MFACQFVTICPDEIVQFFNGRTFLGERYRVRSCVPDEVNLSRHRLEIFKRASRLFRVPVCNEERFTAPPDGWAVGNSVGYLHY